MSPGSGSSTPALSRRSVAALALGLLGLALLLRGLGLGLRPAHSDEAVNGWFVWRLWQRGLYRYRPDDYHGPLLYASTAPLFRWLGASDAVLRLPSVVVGVAGVGLTLSLKRSLGRGRFWAAAWIALSPLQLFFSRCAIHEIWLSSASVLGWAALAAPTRRLDRGVRRAGALAVALAVGFGSKETALLTLLCGAAGWGLARIRAGRGGAGFHDTGGGESQPAWFADRGPGDRWLAGGWLADRWLAAGVVGGLVLLALLYGWAGGRAGGLTDLLLSYRHWVGYGATGRNQGRPPGTYTRLLMGWSWLPMGLALWGLRRAWRERDRAALALSGWWLSAWGGYELIPYKTPWCALQIELPALLLAGWACARLQRRGRIVVCALGLVWGLQGARASFQRYDDRSVPFVYVQTERGFAALPPALDEARELGTVLPVVDAKNPLRWYLLQRGWQPEQMEFHRRAGQLRGRPPVVVAGGREAERVAQRLGPGYRRDVFPDRPGRMVSVFTLSEEP